MFNKLGKTLVIAHTAISILAMSWAAAIFLQFVDFGWKEPRRYLDERVASEYDKRAAALAEAHKVAAEVTRHVVPAQKKLLDAERRFPVNHLFYVRELDRLRNDMADVIEVKEIKTAGTPPEIALDVPVIGKPVLEDAAPVSRSYARYAADFKVVQGQIEKVSQAIKAEIEKEKDISAKLSGSPKTPGLYRLVEIEKEYQDQIKFEKEYVHPRWVESLRQVDEYDRRKKGLEATLDRLKKSQGITK